VSRIDWIYSAPAALFYRVLARLDLGADAASLYDPTLPPVPWARSLTDAYHAAPGRLALQWIALEVADLGALQTRLHDPPAALRDAAGRRLAALAADALAAEAAVPDEPDTAGYARRRTLADRLGPPLTRLRAALWERSGDPPPLAILDVPALRRHGRGRPDPHRHRVAVDLRQDPDHLLCQVLHEQIHPRTDPAVLAGLAPVPRDTRRGTPGHAVHAALEEAALRVGAALIAAREPGYTAAYERWLRALNAPPLTDE
jgi:hypothetical protein